MELDRYFQEIVQTFGPPSGGRPASPETLEAMAGRVPQSLHDFWALHGFGIWHDGLFQLCDPVRYRPIAEAIFGSDSDIRAGSTYLIGMSAFGRLMFWNQPHRIVEANVLSLHVYAAHLFRPKPNIPPEITIGTALFGTNDSVHDGYDADGNGMFARARKAFGPLKFDQIYAPKLHPALGGALKLDNFRPASALEALALAAQAGPFELIDNSELPPKMVRQIG